RGRVGGRGRVDRAPQAFRRVSIFEIYSPGEEARFSILTGDESGRGRASLPSPWSRPDLCDRPDADEVPKALLLVLGELALGMEAGALFFDDAAKGGAIDGADGVGDVVEQALRDAAARDDDLAFTDAQKEKLVGPDDGEHERRREEQKGERHEQRHRSRPSPSTKVRTFPRPSRRATRRRLLEPSRPRRSTSVSSA